MACSLPARSTVLKRDGAGHMASARVSQIVTSLGCSTPVSLLSPTLPLAVAAIAGMALHARGLVALAPSVRALINGLALWSWRISADQAGTPGMAGRAP